MKLALAFRPRSNRRGTLRDLYLFGLIHVFRQPSIFRVWEPLREARPDYDSQD